jgi:hypothetical protein
MSGISYESKTEKWPLCEILDIFVEKINKIKEGRPIAKILNSKQKKEMRNFLKRRRKVERIQ